MQELYKRQGIISEIEERGTGNKNWKHMIIKKEIMKRNMRVNRELRIIKMKKVRRIKEEIADACMVDTNNEEEVGIGM